MARVRRRTVSRGRRRKVFWNDATVLQTSLPTLLLDELVQKDGAFSGIQRFPDVKNDLTLRRSIMSTRGRVTLQNDQADKDTVVEICIGIGFFDSMGDVNGLGINTTLVAGTGPLDDASNSRWHIRCCISIPIGQFNNFTAPQDSFVENHITKNGDFGWWVFGGATAEFGFYCNVDSKVMRKLHGRETPFQNVALQAQSEPVLTAAQDVNVRLNHFVLRQVYSA